MAITACSSSLERTPSEDTSEVRSVCRQFSMHLGSSSTPMALPLLRGKRYAVRSLVTRSEGWQRMR